MASNREIAHAFSGDPFGSRKGSNFFYEKGCIYSYGHHFCIAKVLREVESYSGKFLALVTRSSYSSSTARHVSYVQQAISHWDQISVTDPVGMPMDNLRDLADAAEYCLDKAVNSRQQRTRDSFSIEFHDEMENMEKYIAELARNKFTISVQSFTDISAKDTARRIAKLRKIAKKGYSKESVTKLKKDLEKAQEKDRVEKARKNAIRDQESIREWKAGGTTHLRTANSNREAVHLYLKEKGIVCELEDFNVLLRLTPEKDTIQTSLGYILKISDSKLLYMAWKRGKAVGLKFQNWIVRAADKTGMHIGCHSVPAIEIEEIAKELGWSVK
jgi:hypothetical protein